MKKKRLHEQLIKAMKITIAQMFLAICFISIGYAHTAAAQSDLNQKIYLKAQDESLSKVLKQIEKQTKIRFVFSSKLIQSNQKVNATFAGDPLSSVLDNLLQPRQLQYKVVDKVIILKKVEDSKTSIAPTLPPTPLEKIELAPAFIVTGTVTDEKGEPLVGASVVLEGTTKGTLTDENGNYKFELNETDKKGNLVFSFIGFDKQVIAIDGRSSININLVEAGILKEVVVVGYGTQKKENLTGAVSSIDGQVLENRPVTNAATALQGVSPGLIITRQNGQPGAEGIGIQIRGATTANGSVDPLVVLDGISVPSSTLTTINPNDIDNISVLKDAAAASIYGAQAAGGVILITTKKAKTGGKIRFDYTAQRGVDWSINIPKRMPLLEEAEFSNLARKNSGSGPEYSDVDLQRIRDGIPYVVNPADTTTWIFYNQESLIDQVVRKYSPTNIHNLSVQGGTEKLNFFISGGMYQKEGIFKVGPDDFKRYNFRANLSTQLSKILSVDMRIGYTHDQTLQSSGTVNTSNGTVNQVNGTGLMFEIYRLRTRTPFFTPDGQYNGAGSAATVYARLEAGGYNKYNRNTFDPNITLRAKDIVKGLTLTAKIGTQYRVGERANFARTVPLWGRGKILTYLNQVNGYTLMNETTLSNNIQFLADYVKKIGKHNFSLSAGYIWENFRYSNTITAATNLVSNDLPTLNLGDDKTKTNFQAIATNASQAIFGRFSYNYNSKYLLEGTLRRDESSKLSPDSRSKWFPSVSAGWNIHKESFFPKTEDFTEFKLRGSWGRLGGALGTVIGNYDYLNQLSRGSAVAFGESRASYLFQSSIPSNTLSFETIETTNGGVDLGFFKNRLQINGDYYVKYNRNMLTAQNLPAVIGIGTPRKNNGTLKSWGWELEARYKGKIGKSFNYNIGANISDNQNKLVSFGGRNVVLAGTVPQVEGFPVNSIFGYTTAGYFTSADEVKAWAFQDTRTGAGDVKYLDLNGDGKITIGDGNTSNMGDIVYLGNIQPRYLFGTTLGFNWKGFDFQAMIQGVGKRVFRAQAASLAPLSQTIRQALAVHRDYWTPENPNALFPRPYIAGDHNYLYSDKWLMNGQYARLKNIQIGYSLPAKLLSRAKISKVRLFLSAQDILTVSKLGKFKGYFDPEQRDGIENDYPFFATAAGGINISF